MAILTEVPGITITVEVAGQDVAEYEDIDDQERNPKRTSAFIEAQSGVPFGFGIQFDPRTFAYKDDLVHVQARMDGKLIVGMSIKPADIQSGRRRHLSRRYFPVGDRMVYQNFSFAELLINEGDADDNLWNKLDALGTMELCCYRCRYEYLFTFPLTPPSTRRDRSATSHGGTNLTSKETPSILANDTVSEKTLKGSAISHQARFTVTQERPLSSRRYKPRKKYIDRSPFATFVFKYRSREALQQLRAIPRSPTPQPLEESPAGETTALETIELLQGEQREQHAEATTIKTVKRERKEVDCKEEEEDVVFSHTVPKKRTKVAINHWENIIVISDDDE